MTARATVCQETAAALDAASKDVPNLTSLVGFDGFVDEICGVVETRSSATDVDLVPTIGRLGDKITQAAGKSSNYEIVTHQRKLGGNGPIMANALASFGMDVTYVGNLGYPDIDPVFADFGRRADLRSVAAPGYTDALEFEDGKLMLGKHASLDEVSWENITQRLGPETFERLLGRSRLVAMVNWTMLPQMSRIWAKLIGDVFDELPEWKNGPRRAIFVDLADPEKRLRDDLLYAVKLIGKMQPFADVTLGLNWKEAQQVGEVLKVDVPEEDSQQNTLAAATAIRQTLGVACCVVHPRSHASAATEADSASFAGPFVSKPRISTGAGDHFNAGFMLGRTLDLPLPSCLACGVATSGHYVRTAESPSLSTLSSFIGDLPDPE
jgi:sugar/nucleoside kinase (ribokinase family)